MIEKSTDEDDDGWNDNYDGDDHNIDEIDGKNDQKIHKYFDFWVKIYLFQGVLLCGKRAKKIRRGPPPLIQAMPESKRSLFLGDRPYIQVYS